jgi:hypothetical protein
MAGQPVEPAETSCLSAVLSVCSTYVIAGTHIGLGERALAEPMRELLELEGRNRHRFQLSIPFQPEE